ncbi:MAG: hypothetical protein VW907_00525 [Opitutae bacterium]
MAPHKKFTLESGTEVSVDRLIADSLVPPRVSWGIQEAMTENEQVELWKRAWYAEV